jgi:tyrosinase
VARRAQSSAPRQPQARADAPVTVTALSAPAPQPATLTLRPSVTKMSAEELATFRRAIAKALALEDERGYQYFANWHGVIFQLCIHHEPLFLPWHRAYLYYLELALRALEPTTALPWWDWTASPGIPAAYDQENDPGGGANVLLKAPIKPWGPAQEAPPETNREEGVSGVRPPPYDLTYVLAATSYTDFNKRLWEVHDTVHIWVGGTMEQQEWAAYDPLFWAHHCMVDRVWRIWQHSPLGADPPANLLDIALEPKGMTVRKTLDVTGLGYDYAATSSSVAGTT